VGGHPARNSGDRDWFGSMVTSKVCQRESNPFRPIRTRPIQS
jgi:hypothetical protein